MTSIPTQLSTEDHVAIPNYLRIVQPYKSIRLTSMRFCSKGTNAVLVSYGARTHPDERSDGERGDARKQTTSGQTTTGKSTNCLWNSNPFHTTIPVPIQRTFWTRSPDEDPKLNSKTPLTGTPAQARLPPPRDSVPSGIFEDPAAHRWGLDPKMLHTANQLRDEYA